jgi:hypothetical protein
MITSLQMQDLDKLSIRSNTTSAVPKVKKREEELHVHFSESGRTGSERAAKWNSVDASGTETSTGSMNDFSQKNVLHRSSVSTEQQRPTTTFSARKGSSSRCYEECSAPSMINQQIPGHHGSSSSSSSSSSGPPRHPYSSEEKSATSRSTMNDEFSNDRNVENVTVLPNVLEESFNAMLMAWYQSGYATGRYQALLEQSMKSNNHECDNHTQQPSYHNQHQNQNNQNQHQPPHPPYFDNNKKK